MQPRCCTLGPMFISTNSKQRGSSLPVAHVIRGVKLVRPGLVKRHQRGQAVDESAAGIPCQQGWKRGRKVSGARHRALDVHHTPQLAPAVARHCCSMPAKALLGITHRRCHLPCGQG